MNVDNVRQWAQMLREWEGPQEVGTMMYHNPNTGYLGVCAIGLGCLTTATRSLNVTTLGQITFPTIHNKVASSDFIEWLGIDHPHPQQHPLIVMVVSLNDFANNDFKAIADKIDNWVDEHTL